MTRASGNLVLASVVGLTPLASLAQTADTGQGNEPSSALLGCKQLAQPQERLKCYDTVLGREASDKPATDQPARPDAQQPEPTATAEAGTEPAQRPSSKPAPSPLAERWELVAQADRGPFVVTPYKPTYVLPVSYNTDPNEAPYGAEGSIGRDLDHTEIEFQLSFKSKLWPELLTPRGDLWFGYTQRSYWQAYKESAPFRETNFEPELIYSYQTDFSFLGLNNRLLTLGLNHQSNGRSDPLSRSWNRVTAGALFDHGDYAMQLRGWYRIPESDDDNPGIVDYIGRGEIWQFYRDGDDTWALMLRSNFDPGELRGAVQLDYSFGLGGPLKGYIKLFHGYGDGLIDYDHESTRLGVGVMLFDWF